MVLYSHTITPRLQYIAEFIGKELGTTFRLTTDKEIFMNETGPKINYSGERISETEIWIQSHSLLFEKALSEQTITCFEWKNRKVFFGTGGDLPFDIFAASFYLLSRYEEYLPHKKDMYGRYAFENSLAFREGFLSLPLVNIWLQEFRQWLAQRFPGLPLLSSPFSFLPTYDIDEAWSYKYKSAGRTLGATLKNLIKGKWKQIAERKKVRAGKIADPFDAYEWMDTIHEQHGLRPLYFFLVPERTGQYDRNILPAEKALQELIKEHGEKYKIGVHPSWQSGDDPLLLKKEIGTLEQITGRPITSSRQHFIRFTLPNTYRELIAAGIREDFSMGYGSINGFRASVTSLFNWYDLEKEERTDLLIYPFCFMDANSFYEQKFSPAQALDEMQTYYREVKAVNGTFISIWHNTFLGTSELFAGWREMYEKFIHLTVSV